MMLYEYKFSSCYAGYIEGLIEQKHNSGYIYNSEKYKLIEFDRFCISQEIKEELIIKNFPIHGKHGMTMRERDTAHQE